MCDIATRKIAPPSDQSREEYFSRTAFESHEIAPFQEIYIDTKRYVSISLGVPVLLFFLPLLGLILYSCLSAVVRG